MGDGVITGTFFTKYATSDTPETTGRWKVTRLPPRTLR